MEPTETFALSLSRTSPENAVPRMGGGCQASPAQGRHALFWGGHLVPDTGPGKASQSREEKKKGRPHHQVDVGRGLGAGHGRETPGLRGRLSVRRTGRAARGPGLRARATPRACEGRRQPRRSGVTAGSARSHRRPAVTAGAHPPPPSPGQSGAEGHTARRPAPIPSPSTGLPVPRFPLLRRGRLP